MATYSDEPSQFAIVEDDPFMAQLVSDMLSSGGVGSQIYGRGLDLLKSADLPKLTGRSPRWSSNSRRPINNQPLHFALKKRNAYAAN